MLISDWSSDVCSSDLRASRDPPPSAARTAGARGPSACRGRIRPPSGRAGWGRRSSSFETTLEAHQAAPDPAFHRAERGTEPRRDLVVGEPVIIREQDAAPRRSEEHTSELQSLMRNSYAVFCLKTKTQHIKKT